MSEREVAREKQDQAFADYWERYKQSGLTTGYTRSFGDFCAGWNARGFEAGRGRWVPVDMIIHCPKCGVQHVDAPEPDICVCGHRRRMHKDNDVLFKSYCDDCSACNGFTVAWDNPPHKKHKCRPQDGGCGEIFKTANLPTNGVAALEGQPQPDEPVEKGEVCENKENGNESRV